MQNLGETVTQKFHREVKELKAQLPRSYKMALLSKLPSSYDTYGGGVRISNVMQGRVTDTLVLEALKALVFEQSLKKTA